MEGKKKSVLIAFMFAHCSFTKQNENHFIYIAFYVFFEFIKTMNSVHCAHPRLDEHILLTPLHFPIRLTKQNAYVCEKLIGVKIKCNPILYVHWA
jgi:hypothetical protein